MTQRPETTTDTPVESPLSNPFAADHDRQRVPDPCLIVLFGATGDLTRRKLAPALYNLAREGYLPHRLGIVGFARREKSDEEFRADVRSGLREFSRGFAEGEEVLDRFVDRVSYHRGSFDDPAAYRALARHLERRDRELGTAGNRLYYLATDPGFFCPVVKRLGEAGLTERSAETERAPGSPWTRVVVEKPFGRDLESAARLNHGLLEVLDESQVYRIDHYLGKETVQNILTFRFANEIFEPLWSPKYIRSVQITVAESLGVGGRGPYYDSCGALRDMVQNHMMQLLCLTAMEPPVSTEADAVRDEKVKVLRALRPLRPEDVQSHAVRGQYADGSILGEGVPAYRVEERVPGDSTTETYCALRLHIDNWRWAGVPFLLRHGKRLPKRATEIAIRFRTRPLRLFESGGSNRALPNALVVDIQPNEGISLEFNSKVPGPEMVTRPVRMDFRYGSSFGTSTPEAYERLLLDALLGDSTLFTRRDEVEASWRFMDTILDAWAQAGEHGLHPYAAGSWGPAAADRLLGADEGDWRRP